MDKLKPALSGLYKTVLKASETEDLDAIRIVRAMLDSYHKATKEADNAFGFDLFLVTGLLLDTPSMGRDALKRLNEDYPEYTR